MVDKVLTTPWNYDLVRQELEQDAEGYKHTKKENKQLYQNLERAIEMLNLRISTGNKDADSLACYHEAIEQKKSMDKLLEETETQAEWSQKRSQIIAHAIPFRIGYATLDSLFNQKPSSYDYITNGQCPFSIMFIEFPESYPIQIPFEEGTKEGLGILYYRESRSEPVGSLKTSPFDVQKFDLYFKQPGQKKICYITLILTPEPKSEFFGI